MSGLVWPGDHRAGELMGDGALLRAMVAVESAWLASLAGAGVAPASAAIGLGGLVDDADLPALSTAAEGGGNPVIPLVALLRSRAGDPAAAWLHRGLTSQDVLDTALVLCLREVVGAVRDSIRDQVGSLADLAVRHRTAPMIGRTLTRHAVPITVGAKVASWLGGVLDAAHDLDGLTFPVQVGGAAGTLSGVAALGADPVRCATSTAEALGLSHRSPWHTARAPITRIGDALARCTDGWGRIASDVLTLGRPEIAELAEHAVDGRGGSSAMPHKQNPVLSVLIRRAAITAPGLAAQLHLAAALTVDERPDGAWHAEWQPLQLLGRHAVTAGRQTAELLAGLHVDVDRARSALELAGDAVLGEHRRLAALAGRPVDPAQCATDAANAIVDTALDRAHDWLGEG